MCQMSNIWHLTHQTLIFMLYEMFQISNSFATCYSMVPYMKPHCSMLQIFLSFFLFTPSLISSLPFTLYLFPLSPPYSRPLSSMLKISRLITSPLTSTTLAADLHIPRCRPPIPCLSFLLSMSLSISSLSSLLKISRHLTSLPTSKALAADLQIS